VTQTSSQGANVLSISDKEPQREQTRVAEPPFVARVRLRAQRRVLWMRALWAAEQSGPVQGLAISHGEVDRITADPAEIAAQEAIFYEEDPVASKLATQIGLADSQTSEHHEWRRICQEFDLSQHEKDLLALALAVEVDPLLRRVYGYLHDDAGAAYATPWLASVLFQWSSGVRFGMDSALLRWRLARPLEGTLNPWAITAPWTADPHLVLWATQGACLDPVLGTAVHIHPARETQATCLYPEQLTAMRHFIESVWSKSNESAVPLEIEIVGPEGAGKRTLATQFAAMLGADLICADARLLLGTDVPRAAAADRVVRAVRLAKLAGGILYWHGITAVDPAIWEVMRGYPRLMVLGNESALPRKKDGPYIRRSFHLPPLSRAARIGLWEQLTEEAAPAMVAEWMLTPAEIVNAVRMAPAGAEAVAEVCQEDLGAGPQELFTPLVCPFTWDDIILSKAVRDHLLEFEQQVRLRWQVYEDWGFGRLCPLGTGITAMFAGPSGTGKTMAAQVLARSLGMKLYRVDLAGVINKYIGETEKRLKQVFDACERANVMLFFDEADALFGQRTQVKDAHDRFANIEIDYLLQRMEQFQGIAILATNRKSDLDKAFLRRVRFIVDFMPPGPPERLALWHRVLPAQTANGEQLLQEIDWNFLATKLNMTGADITSAALDAAFLAYGQGKRIGMEHVLHAARRTMTKQGIVLRPGDLDT
jgi:AAA+ superfamily predicted ATPase